MAGEADQIAAAMAQLLSAQAARIVAPAAPPGADIRSLRATQVLFRPERRVTVSIGVASGRRSRQRRWYASRSRPLLCWRIDHVPSAKGTTTHRLVSSACATRVTASKS